MKFKIFLLGILLALSSCVGDEFDFDNLDDDARIAPKFSAPFGNATITLADLVSDTAENVFYDSSGAYPYISFSIREDSIFSYNGGDFFEIKESGSEDYQMGQIEIDDFGPVTNTTTFGSLLDNTTNYQNEVNTLQSADGGQAIFPEIPESNPMDIEGTYETEPVGNYKTATFSSGNISITFSNNLPAPIRATFDLYSKNESGTFNNKVKSLTYSQDDASPYIQPGNSETQTVQLTGKTLGSIFYLTNLKLTSPGTNPNPVDIRLNEQNISLSVTSSNLTIESGNVQMKEQELYEKQTAIAVGSEGDKQIDTINLQSGGMNYDVQNKSNIPADLVIKLPKSKYISSQDTVKEIIPIPANSTTTGTLDMSNTITDITGNDSLPIYYRVELATSQNYSEYSASDEIVFNYDLTLDKNNIDFISGYFGQDTIEFINDEINTGIDIFSNIAGGLTLTDPKMKFFFNNTVGVPFTADIDMKGISSEGEEQPLNSDLLNFEYPSHPGGKVEDTLVINRNNSDIVDFIGLPPNSIEFSGEGYINYSGDTSVYNFITNNNKVNVGMLMDLPLELKASGLTFKDTMDLNLDMEFEGEVNLYAKFTNSFPFSMNVKLICIDSQTDSELLTLEAEDENQQPTVMLEAPPVDNTGRVTSPTNNTVFFRIQGGDIDKLQQSDKVIFVATISTSGENGVKFYTDYKLKIALGIKNTGTKIDL
jgi:hypothetical protein